MKITVIELLNKMASDEEVPTKIKYNYITWEWNEKQKDYIELNGATRNLFTYYLDNLTECLNNGIEIIEESKEELEEIELIDNRKAYQTVDFSGNTIDYKWEYNDIIQNTKINELIENQNKIVRELKDNKKQ